MKFDKQSFYDFSGMPVFVAFRSDGDKGHFSMMALMIKIFDDEIYLFSRDTAISIDLDLCEVYDGKEQLLVDYSEHMEMQIGRRVIKFDEDFRAYMYEIIEAFEDNGMLCEDEIFRNRPRRNVVNVMTTVSGDEVNNAIENMAQAAKLQSKLAQSHLESGY